MEFRIEFRGSYFLATTSGVARVEGFGELLDTMFRHEEWKPGYSFVADHSDLDVGHLDTDDIRKIALGGLERRAKAGVARHAVVAPRDIAYGLSRMWLAYVDEGDGVASSIFRSREEAIAWVSAEDPGTR